MPGRSIRNGRLLHKSVYALTTSAGDKTLLNVTTYVPRGKGWEGIIATGTWQGRPIKYLDEYEPETSYGPYVQGMCMELDTGLWGYSAKVVTAAGTYSFSATGWDSVTEGVYSATLLTKRGDGAILADFAPVLTVNKVKKVLAIHANLWFDRQNGHDEGVGGASFQ